jgi:DNA-binding IscR family transcriptional regulator
MTPRGHLRNVANALIRSGYVTVVKCRFGVLTLGKVPENTRLEVVRVTESHLARLESVPRPVRALSGRTGACWARWKETLTNFLWLLQGLLDLPASALRS